MLTKCEHLPCVHNPREIDLCACAPRCVSTHLASVPAHVDKREGAAADALADQELRPGKGNEGD